MANAEVTPAFEVMQCDECRCITDEGYEVRLDGGDVRRCCEVCVMAWVYDSEVDGLKERGDG